MGSALGQGADTLVVKNKRLFSVLFKGLLFIPSLAVNCWPSQEILIRTQKIARLCGIPLPFPRMDNRGIQIVRLFKFTNLKSLEIHHIAVTLSVFGDLAGE